METVNSVIHKVNFAFSFICHQKSRPIVEEKCLVIFFTTAFRIFYMQ